MNNDLISRSALKAILPNEPNYIEDNAIFEQFEKIIGNAPTVEPIKQCKYCKHCGNEDYCSNCHSDHSLFEYYERPQGEWIKWNFRTFGAMGDWEYKCSKCEKVYGGEYNFCPNCGARMI